VILEDDDEMVLELLENIPGFLDYMGGINYFERLLKLLENFCKSFESAIRNKVFSLFFFLKLCFPKAILAVKKIFGMVDIKSNEDILVGFVKKCYSSEFHCGKEAAASLIPSLYQKLSNNNQNLFFG
jgi:hypothetical protein